MTSQPARPDSTSLLTTVYRLTVMGGFLACGSLVAVNYGPEAGDLADMIDGAAAMVIEVPEGVQPDPTPASEPDAFALFESQPVTLSDAPPVSDPSTIQFDPAVTPASATQATPGVVAAVPLEPLEQARLIAPLLSAGATQAAVTPWGAMYRATASAPVGDGTTGLQRQFDGLGGTPAQAVARVEREVRAAYLR